VIDSSTSARKRSSGNSAVGAATSSRAIWLPAVFAISSRTLEPEPPPCRANIERQNIGSLTSTSSLGVVRTIVPMPTWRTTRPSAASSS
jgi:hypothetical protein